MIKISVYFLSCFTLANSQRFRQPPFQAPQGYLPPQDEDVFEDALSDTLIDFNPCKLMNETECTDTYLDECTTETKTVCINTNKEVCTSVSTQSCRQENKEECATLSTQRCEEVPTVVIEENCIDIEEIKCVQIDVQECKTVTNNQCR